MRDNNKKRTQIIYGNCKVYHPNGTLMFLCVEKRARWYLDRNLATVIEDDPLTIKLTFEPSGSGAGELSTEETEYLLGIKHNHCVVCGTDDLSILTRHHVVPTEYRKFFPLKYKSRSSHDVVVICQKHHNEYENNHALKLKRSLEKSLGVESVKSVYTGMLKWVKANRYAKMLMDPDMAIKLPKSRVYYFMKEIQKNFGDMSIVEVAEIDALKHFREKIEVVSKSVVEKLEEDPVAIQDFIMLWRKNFIEAMNPQYLPKGWSINHQINKHKI